MRLSLAWLAELAEIGATSAEEVQRLLTFHTAEVEGIEEVGSDLAGVVTARVLGVRPHPAADRLRLCRVDPGSGETREVVCGAPNVAEGQVVCFAPEGVTLPGGLTLERRKIRGVESAGMICAEDELGLGEDHEGILVLPEATPVGLPVARVLGGRDRILDVSNAAITHRPDLWGHVGFARELAALLDVSFTPPATPAADEALASAAGEAFPIAIEDEEGCRRYVGVVLEGVVNGPSPLSLRRRLESLGMRSLDLVVDLTNLVLLEQGQPLHAFDLDRLEGGEVRVRRARAGERIQTLDGVDRALDAEDLVIADARRAIAIAGVMGGSGSEVGPGTTRILLEAATFDPIRVRRTAARLGLRTEASTRFEKGLDPAQAERAARRFTELLLEHVPGARVTRTLADVHPRPLAPLRIRMSYDVLRRRLGLRISDAEMRARLASLGFDVTEVDGQLDAGVPSWRAVKDVQGPEDLIEEVGRLVGYEQVPQIVPVGTLRPSRLSPLRRLERRLATLWSLDRGWSEVQTYAFHGRREAERLGLSGWPHVGIQGASEEQDRLVVTTAGNLLAAAGRNVPRVAQGRLWELTRLFPVPAAPGELPAEARVLGLVAWDRTCVTDAAGTLFLSVLEDLRLVLAQVPVADLEIRGAADDPLAPGLPPPGWLHPGRRAALVAGERLLGWVGEVLPSVARAFEIDGRVVHGELSLEAVLAARAEEGGVYRPVHRFPVVPFDVAVVVPDRTPAAKVAAVLREAVGANGRAIRVFDVYRGSGIPEGWCSVAFSMELLDPEGTVRPELAETLRGRVREALAQRGWTIRAGDAGA